MFWNAWFQTYYIYLHIPIVLRFEMHDFKHTMYVNKNIYIYNKFNRLKLCTVNFCNMYQYACYIRNAHSPNMNLVSNFFTKQKIRETSNACESCHSHPPSRAVSRLAAAVSQSNHWTPGSTAMLAPTNSGDKEHLGDVTFDMVKNTSSNKTCQCERCY